VSTPPTIAASITPASMNLDAEANVFALEEHAVEIAAHGPESPKRARTYCATDDVLCVWR
jgi:hypothetical protein